jgi:putative ABC transport system permease protein
LEADVQREAGISAAEARYAARRLFGNTAQVKEQVRESWPLELARPPAADLRYAIRTMRSGGPIGTRISIDERDGESLWRQIVGIVGDTKQNNLAEPIQPEFYVPLAQAQQPYLILAVRTRGDPAGLTSAVRREVTAVNKDQPLSGVRTLTDLISGSLGQPRFQALLLGTFGMFALLLAAVGIFGLVSYSGSQRTHLWLALPVIGIGLPVSLAWSHALSRLRLDGQPGLSPLRRCATNSLHATQGLLCRKELRNESLRASGKHGRNAAHRRGLGQ